MKKILYGLLIVSYVVAQPITTSSMVNKTYSCVDRYEDALLDLTVGSNGLIYVNPWFDSGDVISYKAQSSSTILVDGVELATLSNATENSFDLTIPGEVYFNCHDNFENALKNADSLLPTITDGIIVVDGNANEWNGMTNIDATQTTGFPLDITTMKVSKDSNYIYILIQTDKDISTFMPGTDSQGWNNTLWIHLNNIEIGTQNGVSTQWREAWPGNVPLGIPAASWDDLVGEAELVINGNTVEAKYPRTLLNNLDYIHVSASFGSDRPGDTNESGDDYSNDWVGTAAKINSTSNTVDGIIADTSLDLNAYNLSGISLVCTGNLFLDTIRFTQTGDFYLNSFSGEWNDHATYTVNDIDRLTLNMEGGFVLDLTNITSDSVTVNNALEGFSSTCYRTFTEALSHRNTDLVPQGTMTLDGTVNGWENTLKITADTQSGSPIDITQINVAKDNDYVYLMFQTDNPIVGFLPGNDGSGNEYMLFMDINDQFTIGSNGYSNWFIYSSGDHDFSTSTLVDMGIDYTVNSTVFQTRIPKDLVGKFPSIAIRFAAHNSITGENAYDIDNEKINFIVDEPTTQINLPALMYLLF